MKRLGLAVVLGVGSWMLGVGCQSAPTHPAPPPALRLDVGVYGTSGAVAGALVQVTDGPNAGIHGTTAALTGGVILTGLKAGTFSVCASAPQMVKGCTSVELRADSNTQIHLLPAKPPEPPPLPAPVVKAAGRIFTANGQPWRYKGVSAFALLDRFAKGHAIDDTLNAYRGFNVLRVWEYVPVKDWGARAWDVQSVEVTNKFLAYVGAKGWNVELTLLTDGSAARVAWAKTFTQQLTAGGCPKNLLLEGQNEPLTNDKRGEVDALKGVLAASGCLYTSGIYEKPERFWGLYGVSHDPRDSEWPRKVHDLLERYNGGGPYAQENPPNRVPWVGDEPAKPEDVNMTSDDAKAYSGGAALMAAGATWHSSTGKFGLPPTASEAVLAAAFLEGLNAFPENAPNLGYGRPVENSLRTYTAGGTFMVRVRPTTADMPGWSRIGSSNILWKR